MRNMKMLYRYLHSISLYGSSKPSFEIKLQTNRYSIINEVLYYLCIASYLYGAQRSPPTVVVHSIRCSNMLSLYATRTPQIHPQSSETGSLRCVLKQHLCCGLTNTANQHSERRLLADLCVLVGWDTSLGVSVEVVSAARETPMIITLEQRVCLPTDSQLPKKTKIKLLYRILLMSCGSKNKYQIRNVM